MRKTVGSQERFGSSPDASAQRPKVEEAALQELARIEAERGPNQGE
jgi:hypothetical protein